VIKQPRRHELFDPRHTHGRGDRIVLADTSLGATDESYDQLAAEAVAENEGMPTRGSRASAVRRPARIRRRDRNSRRVKKHE
jgi:hypothetical protein